MSIDPAMNPHDSLQRNAMGAVPRGQYHHAVAGGFWNGAEAD